jgi:7-carboxy-7-deazaguanine synthase
MAHTPVSRPASGAILVKTLKVNEIFFSLQGETGKTGLPTAFIRLTGCPLRCSYCDTEYAFYDGEKKSIAEILQTISRYRSKHVTVTGGEPLAQPNCPDLLKQLCDEGFEVSLETGGAMDIAGVDPRVVKVLDIKTPGSGEAQKNRYGNLEHLGDQDEIKFVICNRTDYEWARDMLGRYRLNDRCEVLFSPSHEELAAAELAGWILEDRLPVRLQVQLHKYLWGDVPGR